MIIDDFNVLGSRFSPKEADPVLIVDSNRMLTRAISFQLLQLQTWQRQGPRRDGRVQAVQYLAGLSMEMRPECFPGRLGALPVEDVSGALVSERDNQTRRPCPKAFG